MKKPLVAVVLLVIALSGCASAGAENASETARESAVETSGPTAEAAEPDSTPEAAPIPAATSTPEVALDPNTNPYMGDYTAAEFYLVVLKPAWRGALPTDEQLAGAGILACDLARAGTATPRVVEGVGEDADWNNEQIVSTAKQSYCYDQYGR